MSGVDVRRDVLSASFPAFWALLCDEEAASGVGVDGRADDAPSVGVDFGAADERVVDASLGPRCAFQLSNAALAAHGAV